MVKSQRIRKQCKYSVLLIVCCLVGKIAFDVMVMEEKVCRVFNGSHGERGQKHKLYMLPVALQMHDGVQELYRMIQ